jgi:putative ABC transport system permease protein
MTRPPRVAEAMLRASLPPGLARDALLGDLEAEFHERAAQGGFLRARVAYWAAALALAFRYTPRRAAGASPFGRVGRHVAPGGTYGPRSNGSWGRDLLHDLRYALRTLTNEPGWAAATLATLALGIGATAAIFTVVHGVLIRPLDMPDPDAVVALEYGPADDAARAHWAGFDAYMTRHMRWHVAYPSYETWREATSDVFTDLGAYDDAWTHDVGFGPEAGTERLPGTIATASLFRALGVPPLMGRLFTQEDDEPGAEAVVLLSYGLWMRRFGGSPDVIGTTVEVRGRPHIVVGVMPPSFAFPAASARLWISMATGSRGAGSTNYTLVGRIRDGITLEQARRALEARSVPVIDGDDVERRVSAHMRDLQTLVAGEIRPTLMVFVAAVGVLLLIACVNVANLMLTRALRRERDRVVRAALGAGPGRLTRQLLTESTVVSVLGAVFGLGLALALVRGVLLLAPGSFPRQESVVVDGTVVLFSLGLATLVSLAVAVAPALHLTRARLAPYLNDSTRGASSSPRTGRLRDGLVVVQLALSLILLVAGGLLTRSLARQLSEETGFDARGVLTIETSLPRASYPTFEESRQFYDELLAGLGRTPGVRSAAAATYVPASGFFHWTELKVEGYVPGPQDEPITEIKQVTPGYFATLGITILEGRPFDDRDGTDGAKVVAVSESLARTYFPPDRALGGRVLVDEEEEVWATVVAVVADVWFRGGEHRAPVVYEPYAASERRGSMDLLVKADGDPRALGPGISRLVTSLDPDVTVYGVLPLETRLWSAVAGPRFRTLLIAALGLASLLLSIIGVYGVMAYMVGQRTRELGIRRVLGARPQGILAFVVRRGLVLTVLGIAIGVLGALQVNGFLRSYLYGLEPHDPVTMAGAVMLLTAASLVACAVPARRAARVDPVVALSVD